MAKLTLVAAERYLRTSYDPDVDYVDGALEDGNAGEFEHGLLQAKLTVWLDALATPFRLFVVTEARVQVSPTRFRIPDICLTRSRPLKGIIVEPPVLCVEVLSPEDRMPRLTQRIRDFLTMGVPVVWLIDPVQRRAWSHTASSITESTDLVLHAGDITLPLTDIFAAIDKLR